VSSQLARWPGSGKFRNRLPGSTVSANTPLWCQGNAFGNEPLTLPNCRPAGGDCGSSVARPSAASADSLGYRAAEASPPLRPPWPFSRALRAAQARRAGALGVFPRKIRFPVAWMADLGTRARRIHDSVVERKNLASCLCDLFVTIELLLVRQGVASTARTCNWWAVLGSNQWPLPCETGVRGLLINSMRDRFPVATRTCYHAVSLDITQCHARSVPGLSQTLRS
jgi:hypothetical protein